MKTHIYFKCIRTIFVRFSFQNFRWRTTRHPGPTHARAWLSRDEGMTDRKKSKKSFFARWLAFEVICVRSDWDRLCFSRVSQRKDAIEEYSWEWLVRVCVVQSCDGLKLCNLEFLIESFERQIVKKWKNQMICECKNEWVIKTGHYNFFEFFLLFHRHIDTISKSHKIILFDIFFIPVSALINCQSMFVPIKNLVVVDLN